jgi:hypothetical protein
MRGGSEGWRYFGTTSTTQRGRWLQKNAGQARPLHACGERTFVRHACTVGRGRGAIRYVKGGRPTGLLLDLEICPFLVQLYFLR